MNMIIIFSIALIITVVLFNGYLKTNESFYKILCSKRIRTEALNIIEEWLYAYIYNESLFLKKVDEIEEHPDCAGLYTLKVIDGNFYPVSIQLKKGLSYEQEVMTLMHEVGHHWCTQKYKDESEVGADRFISEVLYHMPLWIKCTMEPWTSTLFDRDMAINSFNKKEVITSFNNRRKD